MVNILLDNPQYSVSALVVFLGLVVYGFRDLLRFSIKRAWAISSVCFDESIRRRVLWITPLAILGVILVSQFQRPTDEQDVIRQTIKFSLFAAGLLVTITGVILACTNLPKEIETRVIYTIVTKPITRLEIVAGKVIGFAKVSLAILLIMGIFTLGYLHLRAWRLTREISQRLDAGAIDPISRPTYEYWAQQGLLSTRTFGESGDFQIFAREPSANDTKRWFFGSGENDFVVPFYVTPEDLIPAGISGAKPGDAGLLIRVQLGYEQIKPEAPKPMAGSLPLGVAAPSTQPVGSAPVQGAVSLSILDQDLNVILDLSQAHNNQSVLLKDPTGNTAALALVEPQLIPTLLQSPMFYVCVTGLGSNIVYSANVEHNSNPLKNPVCLIVPADSPTHARLIGPLNDRTSAAEYRPALPTFRGRVNNAVEELRGGAPNAAPIAIMKFRHVPIVTNNDSVAFELLTTIERSGDESEADATQVQIVAENKKTGQRSDPIFIYPENNRTSYFNLPAKIVQDGDFDLYIRSLTTNHYVGLNKQSLRVITSQESFNFNLIKSLAILWMLSILVVIVAIFCSTFLSWPIAVVLTLVILLGHWGVSQLGDALQPGIGNQVATDIFGASTNAASQAKVVSASVDALAKILNRVGKVLPDISQFSAIEDIDRGIAIPWGHLWDPLVVLFCFGLPMVVVSYVFLRNKEVAP
jgi:hypothetical protein